MVIDNRAILVVVMSECRVKRFVCKTWTRLTAGTLANSADPDQTPQNAASDQGLYCTQNPGRVKKCLKSPFKTIFLANTQRQLTHQYCQCFDLLTLPIRVQSFREIKLNKLSFKCSYFSEVPFYIFPLRLNVAERKLILLSLAR